jgi:iron complex transport system ATP-binding protein
MISANKVSVSIGSRRILHDVDFSAAPGELTAIIGPNGSGKTTLLKALCLDIASKGDLTINGADLRKLKPWQAATMRAVLPQATFLSFPFTVREVVKLGTTNGRSGAREEELDHLPDMALARVDLNGFAGRFYQELSGGEQQRVQLARILCQVWTPILDGQPRFLLLDEPVSSLDIKHQLMIMNVAKAFAAAGGGVVAILHDLNLTSMYADKVLVMKDGHRQAFGTPLEVLQDQLISDVFECDLKMGVLPAATVPFVLPQSAHL